jgi:hypothetical protein
MGDTDLIARLYPYHDSSSTLSALNTNRMKDNDIRFVQAKRYGPIFPTRCSPPTRAPTEPLEEEKYNPFDYLPYLEFRFSLGPRTGLGFVFGTD